MAEHFMIYNNAEVRFFDTQCKMTALLLLLGIWPIKSTVPKSCLPKITDIGQYLLKLLESIVGVWFFEPRCICFG